jgi:hypothetical protein
MRARRLAGMLQVAAVISVAAFIAVGTLSAFTGKASAEISGPCGATLNGVDVKGVDSGNRDNDIKVSSDSKVPVVFTSAKGFKSHKIQLEFLSRRWTVADKKDDGATQFSDSVNVNDYATYGVGLYKVVGVGTLTDGTTCSGAATVNVGGNPLTTVAGAAAAGTVAVATVGAVATGLAASSSSAGGLKPMQDVMDDLMDISDEVEAARLRAERLRTAGAFFNFAAMFGCFGTLALALLMLPFAAISGGDRSGDSGGAAPPAAGPGAPQRLPRARWTPRITLLGLLSGLLVGVGVVVLLQQYAIEYPTMAAAVRDVAIGVVLYGVVVPTVGRTFAVRRLNGRIAKLERAAG